MTPKHEHGRVRSHRIRTRSRPARSTATKLLIVAGAVVAELAALGILCGVDPVAAIAVLVAVAPTLAAAATRPRGDGAALPGLHAVGYLASWVLLPLAWCVWSAAVEFQIAAASSSEMGLLDLLLCMATFGTEIEPPAEPSGLPFRELPATILGRGLTLLMPIVLILGLVEVLRAAARRAPLDRSAR